jgi:hypothetical protein
LRRLDGCATDHCDLVVGQTITADLDTRVRVSIGVDYLDITTGLNQFCAVHRGSCQTRDDAPSPRPQQAGAPAPVA